MRSTRPIVLFVALALAAAACGGGSAETTTTTAAPTTTSTTTTSTSTTTTTSTSTTTTSTSSTTTTTIYDGPIAPITGQPIDDDALADRRVIAIKVDNHPDARPQSGLDKADGVIEILVEGGYTRFIALFHTTDSNYVGPIRSVRPTDSTVLRPLNAVMVISGGQDWVTGLTAARGVKMIGEVAGTFRISSKVRPHNLFGDTVELRGTADSRNYSDEFGTMLYDIAPWDERTGDEATNIALSWSTNTLYSWQYRDGRYYRYIGYESPFAHNIANRNGDIEQISAKVLVVIEGTRYTAWPSAGVKGNPVPAIDTTGSGPVQIFHKGRVAVGTWSRDSIEDPFEFTDLDGNRLTVPPGDPWIMFFPEQRAVRW